MKKILSICMLLLITLTPVGNSFASEINETSEDVGIESEMYFVPYENSNDKLRISVSGSGGTANLDYMSRGKYLAWRLTASKGVLLATTAQVEIFNSKGKMVAMYPLMDNPGKTKSGIINVKWLKPGKYKAKMSGFSLTSAGIMYIKSGVQINFKR